MKSFEEKVWEAIAEIPNGKVGTYIGIAERIGKGKAFRAVGNACNKNPFAPKVPCHRVVNSNGSIGGYAHGVNRKIRMLEKEGVEVRKGKVADFEMKLFRF